MVKDDKEINDEIAEILARHKALKERNSAKKKLFVCPYCSKTYKSKAYIGAKKHLLSCAKQNKNQKKLISFFK